MERAILENIIMCIVQFFYRGQPIWRTLCNPRAIKSDLQNSTDAECIDKFKKIVHNVSVFTLKRLFDKGLFSNKCVLRLVGEVILSKNLQNTPLLAPLMIKFRQIKRKSFFYFFVFYFLFFLNRLHKKNFLNFSC